MGIVMTSFSCRQRSSAPPVVSIIPRPVSLERTQGSFTIDEHTTLLLADSAFKPSADFLNAYLDKYYGFELPVKMAQDTAQGSSAVSAAHTITLNYQHGLAPQKEAYEMTVTSKGATIGGSDAPGVFYGIQTLIQLLPVTSSHSLEIATVHIRDYPRFGYRGMMLDCGRHFFDTAFVKKFIDFIAMHKMNRFHWHLTEDQGWRIQIKRYPRLTEVGAWRDSTLIGHAARGPQKFDHKRSGGFYTQDEIRAIVAYAKQRYITVIPEIEMPGHSMAAIASYPELTCQPGNYHVGNTWGVYDTILCPTPYTFNFYQNVLNEVMELFPSHYIHIGGDEAPKVTWNNSAYCRALMRKLHLKDADELQSYFINHMEQYLNAHGRDIIGWDEILQGGLAPNATVMSWRGETGGIAAAKMHHDVIMSPTTYCYLDYYQSRAHDSLCIGGYLPLKKVYGYNPLPPELDSLEATYIKGVQANMWTEYIQWPSKVEYQLFPRMEAIAEIAWTPQKDRDYADFVKRVETQFKRYDLWKVSYSRAMYELDGTSEPRADHAGIDFRLKALDVPGKIHYTTTGDAPDARSAVYDSPIHISASAHIRAALFVDGEKAGPEIHQDLQVNKATGSAITLVDEPAEKYSTGGAFTLVDGIAPSDAGSGSGWLGWNGGGMDAKIDLGAPESVSTLKVDYGDDAGKWIYPPRSVSVLSSDDGIHYRVIKQLQPLASAASGDHTATLELGGLKTRYLEVQAENYGTIPAGGPGAGSKAWLFIGEIQVE